MLGLYSFVLKDPDDGYELGFIRAFVGSYTDYYVKVNQPHYRP
jgi:hypothetical protein